MKSSNVPFVLSLYLLISGGVALSLEQIYEKYLSTLIGTTVPAATIVLAIYFSGLTIGALWGSIKDYNPFKRLVFLELFIFAWAIFTALSFFDLYDIFANMFAGLGLNDTRLFLIRLLVALFWILPPAIAMGAQFPAFLASLERVNLSNEHTRTKSYMLNLAGGAVFTLLSAYVFFYNFGLQNTLYIFAILQLILVVTLIIYFKPFFTTEITIKENTLQVSQGNKDFSWIYFIAFFSGFIFFSMEVTWLHLISSAASASTYSFALLLFLVLISLALGAREMKKESFENISMIQVSIFQTLGTILFLFPFLHAAWPYVSTLATAFAGLFTLFNQELNRDYVNFALGEAAKLLALGIIIVPLGKELGKLFPLVFHSLEKGGYSAHSKKIALAIAINTVGSVTGALFTGFVLIENFGAEATGKIIWFLIAGVFTYVAWKIFAKSLAGPEFKKECGAVIFSLIALLALPGWNKHYLASGNAVYLTPSVNNNEFVFFAEDYSVGFTTIESTKSDNPFFNKDTVLSLYQNGKFDANDAFQLEAQAGVGLISSLFSEALDRALIIGVGSGHSVFIPHALGFKHVSVAELSKSHVEAAKEFFQHTNRNVLKANNVDVFIEDGRNFLLQSPYKYDLITSQITSIWFAGATNLYTKEFYEQVRSKLNKGGVFQQWIQIHHITESELLSGIATAKEVFNYVSYWLVGGQTFILASDEPFAINQDVYDTFVKHPKLALERDLLEIKSQASILNYRLLDNSSVEFLLAENHQNIVINTDKNRWIEYNTPRYYLSREDHTRLNLQFIRSYDLSRQ